MPDYADKGLKTKGVNPMFENVDCVAIAVNERDAGMERFSTLLNTTFQPLPPSPELGMRQIGEIKVGKMHEVIFRPRAAHRVMSALAAYPGIHPATVAIKTGYPDSGAYGLQSKP